MHYHDDPLPKPELMAVTGYRGMENKYVVVEWHHSIACGNSCSGDERFRRASEEASWWLLLCEPLVDIPSLISSSNFSFDSVNRSRERCQRRG